MGIGTSRGTHFEDEFQHQAGIPLLPEGDEDMVKKPADTGDDNVLPPDEGSYDNKSGVTKAGLKKVYITGQHSEDNINDSDVTTGAGLPDISDVSDGNMKSGIGPIDKLFGLGVERYKTWPEKAVTDLLTTAGDVSAGKVPMWSMTPDGEFHTSIEGLEAAHKLMPAANGGSMPVSIHMAGEGLKALEAYHEAPYETGAAEQFQQLLRQTRRQSSNILEGEVLPPRPPAAPTRMPGEDNTDFALRSIQHVLDHGESSPILSVEPPYQPHYPLVENSELITHPFEQIPFSDTAAGEARRTASSFHAANEPNPYMPEAFRGLTREQVDALPDDRFYNYGHYQPDGAMTHNQEARWRRIDAEESHQIAEQLNQQHYSEADIPDVWEQPAKEAPTHWSKDIRQKIDEAVKGDKVQFFKDERRSNGFDQEFKFASKEGIGKLSISLKRGGKEVYVNHIGLVENSGRITWSKASAHTFGTTEMKALVKQIMKEYPKAEVLSGTRVSGARYESGATGYASIRLPGRGRVPRPGTSDLTYEEERLHRAMQNR